MIRKSTNEILIKPKVSTHIRLLAIIGGMLLLAAALYLSFDLGVESGHQQFNQDRDMIEQLDATIGTLRGDLSSAQEGLIIAQRHQQIQEEAYKQVSAAYAGSEQKNRYLGSRLDFYRSIISPQDGQSGPSIQDLTARQENDDIVFEVTLIQAIKHKHQVRGNLRLQLYDGTQLLEDWPNSSPRSINFQYFQQISGVIEAAQLNENARMRVELSLQGGEVIERWFDIGALQTLDGEAEKPMLNQTP